VTRVEEEMAVVVVVVLEVVEEVIVALEVVEEEGVEVAAKRSPFPVKQVFKFQLFLQHLHLFFLLLYFF
jgi:hypothetical protein